MEYQNGQPLPGPAPAGAHDASAKRISRRDVTPPFDLNDLQRNLRQYIFYGVLGEPDILRSGRKLINNFVRHKQQAH